MEQCRQIYHQTCQIRWCVNSQTTSKLKIRGPMYNPPVQDCQNRTALQNNHLQGQVQVDQALQKAPRHVLKICMSLCRIYSYLAPSAYLKNWNEPSALSLLSPLLLLVTHSIETVQRVTKHMRKREKKNPFADELVECLWLCISSILVLA